MQLTDVTWLHVEASSRCNAWCPSCERNKNGFGLADGVVEADLSLDKLREVIEHLPKLEIIQFCGNLGDPIIAHEFLDMVKLSIDMGVKYFQIHTNGGARTTEWWTELGTLLYGRRSEVIFAIDGSKETHHIYRQATNWDKIMENATAFIAAGGMATWQFIPFAHNAHEEDMLRTLSEEMGFVKFDVYENVRVKRKPARNWRTGEEYIVELAKPRKQSWERTATKIELADCMHLNLPSLYVNSLGKVSPCCYLANSVQYAGIIDFLDVDMTKEVTSHPTRACLSNCGKE